MLRSKGKLNLGSNKVGLYFKRLDGTAVIYGSLKDIRIETLHMFYPEST